MILSGKACNGVWQLVTCCLRDCLPFGSLEFQLNLMSDSLFWLRNPSVLVGSDCGFRPRLSGKMVRLFCFLILTTRPMVFDNIWWHSIVTIVLPSLLRLHSCRHVDHLLKDVESLHVQDLRWRDASWCFNILGEELGLVLCVMICHDMSWYVCRLQLYDILWYLNVFDGIWWYLLSFVF